MSRPETLERWRQRIDRFDPAKMSVAQFCQDEDVSQATFYKWKKTLRELNQKPAPRSTPAEVKFLPLQLPASAKNQGDLVTEQAEAAQVATPVASTTIELPGGIRIRVDVPTEIARGRSREAQS